MRLTQGRDGGGLLSQMEVKKLGGGIFGEASGRLRTLSPRGRILVYSI